MATIVCQCDVMVASPMWPLLKWVSGGLGSHSCASQRPSEHMRKCVKNTAEMGGEANDRNLWRRCWCSLCEMDEWKLTLLLFMSSLSLWGLCMVVLPCATSLLAILGVGIFLTWWPKYNAKGTSVGKDLRRSRRKDPIGASIPSEDLEGSTESLKAGARWWPQRPSLSSAPGFARSVMESLDITQICIDLLQKLKAIQDDGAATLCEAVKKEYLVCLQCHRIFTGSCPHCSQPAAEQDLPTLAAVLYAVNLLVREEVPQLELRLGLELAAGGEPLHAWEVTWLLPQTAPERCCRACKAPLPRSPGDSEGSQAWLPVLGAQGPPRGQAEPARQDARQAWAKRPAMGSAALRPAAPGESLPGLGPVWPLPPPGPN
ncbi:uncharacterized protein LOC142601142 [Balearica regulorum gibbericeps]|uniref:uncharacterized protein LOC142601142 n=1 Tax=Balearica regulorum gibbericeps TaxID=100784 RepID=UPI003F61BE4C